MKGKTIMNETSVSRKECVFYYPDGQKSNGIQAFIEYYSGKYFLDYSYNVKEKEEKICEIIEKGKDILPEDVVYLMRWKTGDKNAEGDIINCYGKRISCSIGTKVVKVAKIITPNSSFLDIYNLLLSENMSGMGTVYLLTIVWALSGMRYPIYDKYAKIGIEAICTGKKPNEIEYNYPPDKGSRTAVEKMYTEYQRQLSEILGNDWEKKREIDQALWTYGHQII